MRESGHRVWARAASARGASIVLRITEDLALVESIAGRMQAADVDEVALFRQIAAEMMGDIRPGGDQVAKRLTLGLGELRDKHGMLPESLHSELAEARQRDLQLASALVELLRAVTEDANGKQASIQELAAAEPAPDRPGRRRRRAAINAELGRLTVIASGVHDEAQKLLDIASPYRPGK